MAACVCACAASRIALGNLEGPARVWATINRARNIEGLTHALDQAVSRFGQSVKAKLRSPSVQGEPEDQLRGPFERLLQDMAELIGLHRGKVVAVGETRLAAQHIRPDYAVTVRGALAGYAEIKAPGKGADPRRFKGEHDKTQWKRLQSLPNLLYTDGSEFSLWRSGERVGDVVRLDGDIEAAGAALRPGPGLDALFEAFLGWQPVPPRTAKELAQVSARLCRLLRDEVVEALARKTEALTTLAADWRQLLFPQATDEQFADGYAQAVTFGLLMARARGITIGGDLHKVAEGLSETASLIGAALQLLTDNKVTRQALATSLGTLERVLDVVDWPSLSKGRGDAWLYFYEDFLEIYDNTLRKQTGSYYTPPEVVGAMVALVDEALRRPGFDLVRGLADNAVTVCDPATGTGTYVLGVLRHLALRVAEDEGEGAVPGSRAFGAAAAGRLRIAARSIRRGPVARAGRGGDTDRWLAADGAEDVRHRHAEQPTRRRRPVPRLHRRHRSAAQGREPRQAGTADHRGDRQPAVQGQRPGRLGRG